VGVPNDEEIRKKIEDFVSQIKMIVEDIPVELISEDYTSVQAQEVQGEFKKTEKEDTIAAMKILENYFKNLPKN
jgi:RNase H-fold protein (predicted Holliday junction resolvase)